MWMPYDFSYFKFSAVSVDTENNIIRYIDNPATVFERYVYSKRWKAYNLIQEMDVPGEYYIDRDNMKLYYYSPKAITNQKIEIDKNFARIINIDGANNIKFEGLTFAQTNGSFFSANNVENLDIVNCTFKDIGRTALGIGGGELCKTGTYYTDGEGNIVEYWQKQRKNGSYDVDVSGNIFNNIGGTAISITGAGDNDTLTSSRNKIENNIISNIGYKAVHPAISLGGCGITVRNNNISQTTIGAIYVTGGNNHIIEKNELYHIMTESSDWGAFYEGGNDVFRGTKVDYNYIHDMVADSNKEYPGLKTGRVGIYFDENQQGLSAEYNILKNVPAAFNSNHAGNFLYQYNTAVDCGRALSLHNHPTSSGEIVSVGALGLTIEQVEELVGGNQLFYDTYPTLKEFIDNKTNPMKWTVIKDNLEIGCGENNIGSHAIIYSKLENNNEITDYSAFNDPAKQDYRLNADSDVAASMPQILNTSSFDIEEIGIQTDFELNAETASFDNIYPVDGSNIAYQEEYNFSWEPALGANKYTLTIATDKAFEDVVFEKTTMQTGAVVTGLSDKSVYYYKVEAENISRELGTTWLSNGGVLEFGINMERYEDTETPEKPANLIDGGAAAGSSTTIWTGSGIPDEMKQGAAWPIKIGITSDRTNAPDSNWFATGIFLKDKNKNDTTIENNKLIPESNTNYVFTVSCDESDLPAHIFEVAEKY